MINLELIWHNLVDNFPLLFFVVVLVVLLAYANLKILQLQRQLAQLQNLQQSKHISSHSDVLQGQSNGTNSQTETTPSTSPAFTVKVTATAKLPLVN